MEQEAVAIAKLTRIRQDRRVFILAGSSVVSGRILEQETDAPRRVESDGSALERISPQREKSKSNESLPPLLDLPPLLLQGNGHECAFRPTHRRTPLESTDGRSCPRRAGAEGWPLPSVQTPCTQGNPKKDICGSSGIPGSQMACSFELAIFSMEDVRLRSQ